jgi:DNA invertase Pin-like site-specific DNA recombinase
VSRREKADKDAATRPSVAVGYVRLLDGDDGAGLERQRRAIRSEAKRRGLSLAWSCDTSDRRETLERSGIARSLRLLRGERHTALIVADLASLTCSLVVLAGILRRSAEEGWAVVSLGPTRVDTSRREGRVLQSVLSLYDTFVDQSEDEPAVAGQEEARDPDQSLPRERIVWERVAGASLGQIANGLNRDSIAAPGESDSWSLSAVWAELETFRPGSG